VLILKSIDLIEFYILTHYIQCLYITIVAGLAMLLELDNINNNVVE
jgi:hypothetical protein